MSVKSLSEITTNLTSALRKATRWSWVGWTAVKLVFIVGAAAIAAVAQFLVSSSPLSPWQIVGIVASIVAGIGGVIITIKEQDPSTQIAAANEALEAARSLKAELADSLSVFDGVQEQVSRLIALYVAMKAMRSLIEVSHGVTQTDVKLVENLLRSADRSLRIAMDFRLAEHWTLTVYRADWSHAEARKVLVPVATDRSMPCSSVARQWPEGVGPGGICLATGLEVCVPDSELETSAAMMEVGDMKRDHDRARYRSIFAAPVVLEETSRPWGVVIATSERPNHFEVGGDIGVRNSEAVVALASMVALAVTVHGVAKTH